MQITIFDKKKVEQKRWYIGLSWTAETENAGPVPLLSAPTVVLQLQISLSRVLVQKPYALLLSIVNSSVACTSHFYINFLNKTMNELKKTERKVTIIKEWKSEHVPIKMNRISGVAL